jgi:HNH endonuclease
VHHKDHDHANNPPDGSNWELLCVYCHDNEHARQLEAAARGAQAGEAAPASASHRPFAGLGALLKGKR